MLGPRGASRLAAAKQWRAGCVASIGYNGSVYDVERLKWTQTTFIQPQSHPYDRFLWDPVKQTHTVPSS